jgi:hypothetical protein
MTRTDEVIQELGFMGAVIGVPIRDALRQDEGAIARSQEMFAAACAEVGYPVRFSVGDDGRWYVSHIPARVGLQAARLVAQGLRLPLDGELA